MLAQQVLATVALWLLASFVVTVLIWAPPRIVQTFSRCCGATKRLLQNKDDQE
jgi:hypothetical protein